MPPSAQGGCYDNAQSITCPPGGASYFGQDAQYPDRVRTLTDKELSRTNLPTGYDAYHAVQDSLTALTWQTKVVECLGTPAVCTDKPVQNVPKSWQQAADACAASPYGGFSDWHLPNVYELRSIAQYQSGSPASSSEFGGVLAAGRYWTSTVGGLSTPDEWFVDFTDGSAGIGYRTDAYTFICVRGSAWIPKDVSRYQDAEYAASQKVLVDLATLLFWAKDVPSASTWQQGLSYCEGLSYASFTDWRLPGVNELGSLIRTGSTPATDALGIGAQPYWTSTTDGSVLTDAWTVEFTSGLVKPAGKAGTKAVVCVRGRP